MAKGLRGTFDGTSEERETTERVYEQQKVKILRISTEIDCCQIKKCKFGTLGLRYALSLSLLLNHTLILIYSFSNGDFSLLLLPSSLGCSLSTVIFNIEYSAAASPLPNLILIGAVNTAL